ncbi:MAG: LysR family transcriptional regulator, partial [Acutalibacteraceae bacterium]
TINNVANGEYNLGIIRYQSNFDKYFRSMFIEKKLLSEVISEFSYVLLMSRDHPLAEKDDIELHDLADYIEITHADPYVPSMPHIDVKKAELSAFVDKRIYVFERGSQFELLSRVPKTFMWVSPIPDRLLESYNLVQKTCSGNKKIYRDVLIYRKGYKLCETDSKFIEKVCDERNKYF